MYWSCWSNVASTDAFVLRDDFCEEVTEARCWGIEEAEAGVVASVTSSTSPWGFTLAAFWPRTFLSAGVDAG